MPRFSFREKEFPVGAGRKHPVFAASQYTTRTANGRPYIGNFEQLYQSEFDESKNTFIVFLLHCNNASNSHEQSNKQHRNRNHCHYFRSAEQTDDTAE